MKYSLLSKKTHKQHTLQKAKPTISYIQQFDLYEFYNNKNSFPIIPIQKQLIPNKIPKILTYRQMHSCIKNNHQQIIEYKDIKNKYNIIYKYKQIFKLTISNMSSNFQQKLSKLKQTILLQSSKNNQNLQSNNKCTHSCSGTQIIIDQLSNKINKNQLCIQQPIIIQKKQYNQSKPISLKKQKQQQIHKITKTIKNKTIIQSKKQVQPFIPIEIPQLQKKLDLKTLTCYPPNPPQNLSNKQIQIKIQKDNIKDKQCLKKLFKKIHKLNQDLNTLQKQNMQLKLQLQNYKNISKTCNNHQKMINKLQNDKYKLQIDLNQIKKLLQDKQNQLHKINTFIPKQIIKQVIIQKPIQVQIQVPKIIPGPQRIVQKIVQIQVPKYIEIQKPIPISQPYQPPRQIIKTIQVPTYIEKQKPVPYYVQKPIYHQKVVQVPIQVPPIQVPVYVDRFVPQDWQIKLNQYQSQIQQLSKSNQILFRQNNQLKQVIKMLKDNLEVLERHNMIKNRQTEYLMHHSVVDYGPISPYADISSGSVGYSVSTRPHPRAI